MTVRIEQGQKRVRTYLDGLVVADTVKPMLVWEKPYFPTYYFPIGDVRADLLQTGQTHTSAELGAGRVLSVQVGDRRVEGVALRYDSSPLEKVRDLVRFKWSAMDAWFEEDEEVYTHARDPYTRIDILHSSRDVTVEISGLIIAKSVRPRLLFETGLPMRVYLPKTDVRMDVLEPSDTVTHCPYKGQAAHWSARIGDDLVRDVAWGYPTPLPGCEKIAGLLAFYTEKTDITVHDRTHAG